MTNSINELETAEVILVVGSNTTEQHPIIGEKIISAKRRGGKLIVIDPRRVQLAEFADFFLQIRPGSDVACINGLIQVILSEGLEDREFIASRTEGFDGVREAVAAYTPNKVAELTGVQAEMLVEAARIFGAAKSASIVYCMGVTQHIAGTKNVLSLANLAMVTGNLGKEGAGVNPLRGQNNVQGACDMGCLPDVFPGYQRVVDPSAQEKFRVTWGVRDLCDQPGMTIPEMFEEALGGRIKAMVIMGENPLVSEPDIENVRRAAGKLELLVVIDIMHTETTSLADVAFPAASFCEKEGTFTSTERRVQRVRKAIEPLGKAQPDWKIICDLARELGAPGFDFASPEEIFDELRKVTPQYAGISYARLEGQGIQWPCPTGDHPGTPILHLNEFSRGRGKFIPVEYHPPAEGTDDEYPLVLSTGRIIFQYHTGTMTRNSPSLKKEVNEPFVEVNPGDAFRLGLGEGELVKVTTRRGEILLRARITSKVREGMIFIPFHFSEAAANLLTCKELDPVAKIPELKACAARIDKWDKGD